MPAIRIGKQPYGLLPVTSLDRWKGVYDNTTASSVTELAKQLRGVWRSSLAAVPQAGAGDPEQALVAMLGMSPNVVSLAARGAVSREYAANTSWFFGLDPQTQDWDALHAHVQAQLGSIGQGGSEVLLDELGLDPAAAALLEQPLVIDEKVPGAHPAHYLHAAASLKPGGLWLPTALVDNPKIPVLAMIARHSVLRAYGEAAARTLGINALERMDPTFIDIELPVPTMLDWLGSAWGSGGGSLGDALQSGAVADAALAQARSAAEGLKQLAPERLELLLRETLGL